MTLKLPPSLLLLLPLLLVFRNLLLGLLAGWLVAIAIFVISNLWTLPFTTANAKMAKWNRVNGHWKPKAGNGSPSAFVCRRYSLLDAMRFIMYVEVNFALNNMRRCFQLLLGCRTSQGVDMYQAIMNSSLITWIHPDDGNVMVRDVLLPCGRRFPAGAKGTRLVKELVFHLSHNRKEVTHVSVDGECSYDKAEMATLMFVTCALVGHVATHAAAAQLDPKLVDWQFADLASIAINALSTNAENSTASKLLMFAPETDEIVQHNLAVGIPHLTGSTSDSLSRTLHENSGLYRVLVAAHHNKRLLEICRGNHLQLSALINSLIVHPVDHFSCETYLPASVDSPKLLDSNFWFVKWFGGGFMNSDMAMTYSKPWDEVGEIVVGLFDKHAPQLSACFTAIPNA